MQSRSHKNMHYLGNCGMTGVEIFVLSLAKAQQKLGEEATITCHPRGRDNLFELAQKSSIAMRPFHVKAKPRARNLIGKIQGQLLGLSRIVRLALTLRKQKIHTLHIHPIGVHALPAFLAGWLARVPNITVTHHAALNTAQLSRRQRLILALERRWANQVVVTYQRAADELREAGIPEQRIGVIPFCLDGENFRFKARAPREPNSIGFHFLMPARLVEGKGHSVLLAAVQKLQVRYPDVRVTMAGQGPLADALKTEIQSRGLDSIAALTGYTPHDEMEKLFAKADAVVLPSFMPGETFPISLLEAAGMGLPVIGSRWAGIPDIVVDGETGFIVEPRDVDSLYEAMMRLVENPERAQRMGIAAQARALILYDAGAVAARYQDLRKQFLSAKR